MPRFSVKLLAFFGCVIECQIFDGLFPFKKNDSKSSLLYIWSFNSKLVKRLNLINSNSGNGLKVTNFLIFVSFIEEKNCFAEGLRIGISSEND